MAEFSSSTSYAGKGLDLHHFQLWALSVMQRGREEGREKENCGSIFKFDFQFDSRIFLTYDFSYLQSSRVVRERRKREGRKNWLVFYLILGEIVKRLVLLNITKIVIRYLISILII